MTGTDVIDELCDMNGQEDSQMDVANFLPLMLQAQDLVSKLESRVVELESDLENINENHEQERSQLLQELAVESIDLEGQFLDSINLCLNYLKSAQNNQKNFLKRPSLPPVRHDSKFPSNNNNISNYKVELVIPQLDPISYNVVNNNLDTKDYGSEDIADFDAFISDDDDDDDISSRLSIENVNSLKDDDEYSQNYDHLTNFENNDIIEFHDEPKEIEYDRDDDDNILRPSSSVSNSKSENFCSSCNTLLAQVDQHIEERTYLKRDLSALAVSLAEKETLCVKIQSSKESLEQEIDDWINGMFEKINQLVFDEANTREELEYLNRETKGKLENALKSSGSRQDKLREMKTLLVHLDSTKQKQTAPSLNDRNSVLHRSLTNSLINNQRFSRIFSHMSPTIFSTKNPFDNIKRIYIDGIVFEEFQEYVKSLINSTPPTSSNPTHQFMKRCMREDIQPCLFEGNSGWKSPFYKRRLLDAIMKNQCEIQTIHFSISSSISSTPNTSQISSPIDAPNNFNEPPQAPKLKCGLCGNFRSCDFRMKISDSDAIVPPSTTTTSSYRFSISGNPEWIPLDRFCRDRVVAVCDFYAFISHLRQGLFSNSPVWGMYKQCLKYRRKMSMARVGNVSMFEDENTVNNDYLNKSEMEGMVVVVH
ncbi:1244_t:CDS:2 [Scutellospora calospora]|uniref:1244_t:CDS:1 n=1 Tax=Scutellospora calospora TaxID=85575 RepID=A0ACA9LAH7_9GLOM|nr:1244_t:CDS:2 [Scutellospora calospora]